MKRLISLILVLVFCISLSAFADEAIIGGADNSTDILIADTIKQGDIPIKIISDNKIIDTETVVINQRTLIPLRALLESTGAEVKWYNDTQKIDIIRNSKTITVQVGNTIMNTPDGDKVLETAPILHNGTTTYAPLRAIAEEFGINVDWDNGTKTILVKTPEGSPYVDLYDGLILSDYLKESGMTPQQYEAETTLKYEDYKDKLFVEADNAVPFHQVAKLNGLTVDEARALFGLDASVSDNTSWGEILGETSLGVYVEVFMGASQYGLTPEQALEFLKETYGLGNEYTLETKFKYARVIIHTIEAEHIAKQKELQKAEAAKRAQDLQKLPELTKNKIKFTITLSDNSKMSGELYPDVAPKTVENFVKLVKDKFYDGLIFHRVIDGFMIQGGGYDKDFTPKKIDETIVGEFYENGITNALKHEKGIISMARAEDFDSASNQFFIVDEATPEIDGYYAAFGKITSGLDVLEKLSKTEVKDREDGFYDVPVKPIIIKSIRIVK